MNTKMYAAYGRKREGEPYTHVTLDGQMFFASKPLLEEMVAEMQKKHPNAEFKIEEVQHA